MCICFFFVLGELNTSNFFSGLKKTRFTRVNVKYKKFFRNFRKISKATRNILLQV